MSQLGRVLVNSLIIVVTIHRHLDDLVLFLHLRKSDLLLPLSHLDKHWIRNKSQCDPLVTVAPCSPHPVDIGHRRHILVLGWLVVVDHQCHRTDVDPPTDRFRPQQHLDLLVLQLGDPGSFGSRAVLGMVVVLPHCADVSAVPVDVVDLQVIFAPVGSVRVVDQKFVLLPLQQCVEGPQLGNSIEEDDDLRLGLDLGQLLQNIENHCIFIGSP